ncbi:probable TMA16-Protein putative involved in cytoplasmic ribosome function [Zygosaccharomyces bailii ISA1307]|uniref:ZYBA0S09-04148g1_1 n=1 Tax=Zygosaccharomyces bailii (strain CLIB 213 / ATCC 58445 / CBS 680 / BCRC 21525 / NBRC 1098 / NCYC 1416 / NRRL Y-2227) TaxID=1333698 RepID=A0A8J2TAT9_ZYGB2|nr:ZYBA0S09-04148g1_1 [Zygosaccharomyces bailii CLIB 213]CDH14095.1 probable TMA16-Protein putative involved in cytoplasmic ribosome function [Zygosaccharomyces bailii ISA1307]
MPATKSLSKLQKNLRSSGKSHVHPNGRKYQQLARATLRENSLAAKKREHQKRKSYELARVKYIQDLINSEPLKDKKIFSYEELSSFLQDFIQRDNEELEELKKNRRKNRPPSNRQLLLQQKLDREMEEFEKGFLAPDLTHEKNVTTLRNWNGSFGSINSLKTVRVNNKGEQVIGGNTSLTMEEDVEMQ